MLSRERGVYALSSGKLFSLSIAIVIRSSCRPLLANAFTQVATPRHRKTFATVAKRKTLPSALWNRIHEILYPYVSLCRTVVRQSYNFSPKDSSSRQNLGRIKTSESCTIFRFRKTRLDLIISLEQSRFNRSMIGPRSYLARVYNIKHE